MSLERQASLCSDSEIRFGLGAFVRQMKLGLDVRDRCRSQDLAIGVQDEQIARPVEDDASARPNFVFARPHQGAKGGIHSLVPAPLRPGFEMARAVG
jgi:hypothetical protein